MSNVTSEVPETDVTLGESGPISPPSDVTGVPLVIGMGTGPAPVFTLQALQTPADCAQFGTGDLSHLTSLLTSKGNFCYGIRIPESSPGSVGPITKTFGTPQGTTILMLGSLLLDNTPALKGIVTIFAKTVGVSFSTRNNGPSLPFQIAPLGGTKNVVIQLATDPAGKETTIASAFKAAVEADAELNAIIGVAYSQPGSDGSGLMVAMNSVLYLDDGAMQFLALAGPITVDAKPQPTAGMPLSVSEAAGVLSILYQTDANNIMYSTTLYIYNAITKDPVLKTRYKLTLPGTGLLTPPPSFHAALPFGSTGTATVSGTPTDRFTFTIKFTQQGTVGAATSPALQLSFDDADSLDSANQGGSYGEELSVALTGDVPLLDDLVNTGLVLHLTGAFDVNDVLRFEAYPGSYSTFDLQRAITIGMNEPATDADFGFIVPTGPVDGGAAIVIDMLVQNGQGPPQARPVYALLTPRDKGPTEDDPTYEAAMLAMFNGATPIRSQNGRLTIFDGAYTRSYNPLIGRWQRRPPNFYAAVLRALRPVHEQLGNKNSQMGPGPAINYQFMTFYRNALARPQLAKNGFTGVMNAVGKGWYFTEWVTRASKVSRYYQGPIIAVASGLQRVIYIAASEYELDSATTDPSTGAISLADCAQIEAKMEAIAGQFLYDTKIDGKTPATRNPSDIKLVTVLRNYNAYQTEELRMLVQWFARVYFRRVLVQINVVVPLGGGAATSS